MVLYNKNEKRSLKIKKLSQGQYFIGMVPAAGLEPARIIHPPDFESGTSTNFITRGIIYNFSCRCDLKQYDNSMFLCNYQVNLTFLLKM
jgi:hypothetical protein